MAQPMPPPPPPRKSKLGWIIASVVAVLVVGCLGVGLVGMYVTGVIGSSAASEESEPADPGKYQLTDEWMCEQVDVAAFGPGLSKDEGMEISSPEGEGMPLSCYQDFNLTADPESFGFGQLTIDVTHYRSVSDARDSFDLTLDAPAADDGAEKEEYSGEWEEGAIVQATQEGHPDVSTQSAVRDSNLMVSVRMAWSGAEFDAKTLSDGVKDITEQAVSQATR